MAINSGFDDLEFLTCAICLEQLNDPHIFPCLHSFCKLCIDQISRSRAEIECPICRTITDVGSAKKDFRCEEFINHLKTLENKDLQRLSCCGECNGNIPRNEVQLCKDCNAILCFDCSVHHRLAIKTKSHCIQSLSANIPICSKHEKKFDLYCNENDCNILACSKCAILEHGGHSICTVKNKVSEICRDKDFSFQNQLNLMKDSVDKLKLSVRTFEEIVRDIELEMTKRRDCILKIVNTSFEAQMAILTTSKNSILQEIHKEINKLDSMKTDIINIMSGFNSNVNSDYSIINDYQRFLQIITNSISINDWIECASISLTPKQFDWEKGQTYISNLIGYVNEKLFMNNACKPRIYSTHRETQSKIIDIVYDLKKENLFSLECKSDSHTVVKMNCDGVSKQLIIENTFKNYGNFLALLPTGDLIVLCNLNQNDTKKMLLVSEDLGHYKEYHVLFCSVHSILQICSSPCRNFIFCYCRDNSIYKYNLITKNHETSMVHLSKSAKFMSVNENCDYIVFSEYRFKGIFLFSFSNGTILHKFGEDCLHYEGVGFLSESVIVAAVYFGPLQIFDINSKLMQACFPRFEVEGKQDSVGIEKPYSITVCSQRSLFLSEYSHSRRKIYKILL